MIAHIGSYNKYIYTSNVVVILDHILSNKYNKYRSLTLPLLSTAIADLDLLSLHAVAAENTFACIG